jgi:hypothetical protein
MADHQSSLTYDLSPSVTSALGAAYDDMLQSLDYEGTEFLRYALACDLMKAAFAGERDPIVSRNARLRSFGTASIHRA